MKGAQIQTAVMRQSASELRCVATNQREPIKSEDQGVLAALDTPFDEIESQTDVSRATIRRIYRSSLPNERTLFPLRFVPSATPTATHSAMG